MEVLSCVDHSIKLFSDINPTISMDKYLLFIKIENESEHKRMNQSILRYLDKYLKMYEDVKEIVEETKREDLILSINRSEYIRNILINNLDNYDEENKRLFFNRRYRTRRYKEYNEMFIEYFLRYLFTINLDEIYRIRKEIYNVGKIVQRDYIENNIIIVSFRLKNIETQKELQVETDFNRITSISGNINASQIEIDFDKSINSLENMRYFNNCMIKEIKEESCLDVEFNDTMCKIQIPVIDFIIEKNYNIEYNMMDVGRGKKYVIDYIVNLSDFEYNEFKTKMLSTEFIDYAKSHLHETTKIFM